MVVVQDLDARVAGGETSWWQPSDDALDHRVWHLPGGDRSSAGCERTVPLTSTSTLGTVYDASPRTVVWNGSASRQLRSVLDRGQVRQCRGRVHCSRRDRRVERLCDRAGVLVDRPVCVPTCSVSPWRRRAFSVKSTPCQYCAALRAEVRFERDVVLRASTVGRRRHHGQRDRIAAAARQPRILRGQRSKTAGSPPAREAYRR